MLDKFQRGWAKMKHMDSFYKDADEYRNSELSLQIHAYQVLKLTVYTAVDFRLVPVLPLSCSGTVNELRLPFAVI